LSYLFLKLLKPHISENCMDAARPGEAEAQLENKRVTRDKKVAALAVVNLYGAWPTPAAP
jgi:hypothetical protein